MNNLIYIREHESYDLYNGCKLGIATNLYNRDKVYATGEIKRGKFIYCINILNKENFTVEKRLQNYFKSLGLHIKYNSGNEFFKKNIIQTVNITCIKVNF